MAATRGPDPAGTYPARWEADVALADGGTVHVRPVRPDDAERVRAFHARQSRESIYFRYFSPMPKLSQRELDRLTRVDYLTRMAFVALLGDDIVGLASYDLWRDPRAAEVAFIVDDRHQGRGIATVLLEYLIVAARENGFEALTAQVLPENRRMLSVFHRAGFEVSSSFEEGVVEVHLSLEPTEASLALIEERERLAEARSVERLLFPETVAVIGAGREPGGMGHELFRNLLDRGFEGPVFPVNPAGGHVASVRAFASVLDIPDEVDLAIVVVPAAVVPEVVEECARKRVRGLVVVSAGLDALEIDGRNGAQVVRERALRWGMRVIGPESLGVINTAPRTRLHASFAPVRVEAGRVGFLTQSGTLGIAALEHARRVGVGISAFVDIGARVDVSGNDLLQFWDTDERTDVVLLYLETFGNPRKFTRIARRMARTTPIVAVKAGRAAPFDRERIDGGLAAAWPTDATVDAMLAQSGVIRVDTPVELFDVARVLVHQPVPAGRRVAVVTNSRGAGVLAVDALDGAGLELVGEAVDLTWDAGPDDYEAAVARALADQGVDAVLVVYAPPMRPRRAEVARAIAAATTGAEGKPVLATFLGAEIGTSLVTGGSAIPLFEFPSEAAAVLGRLADYAEWRERPAGTVPTLDEHGLDALRGFVDGLLAAAPEGRWLDRDESAELFRLAGLPVARHRIVASAAEAVAAAEELGFPVVLKATGVERYHRGEEGGVALDLHEPAAVATAYERMAATLGEAMRLAVVQEHAPPGADILVGGHQHASFGGVVSLGIGGVMAAANRDLPVRVLPLSDVDARLLVSSSPVAGLLAAEDPGGAATRHCEAFLLRLGAVLDHVPEVADVLANPVIIGAAGAVAVDAWVRLAPYRWDPRPPVRRL